MTKTEFYTMIGVSATALLASATAFLVTSSPSAYRQPTVYRALEHTAKQTLNNNNNNNNNNKNDNNEVPKQKYMSIEDIILKIENDPKSDIIVMRSADWCLPCTTQKIVLERLINAYDDIPVEILVYNGWNNDKDKPISHDPWGVPNGGFPQFFIFTQQKQVDEKLEATTDVENYIKRKYGEMYDTQFSYNDNIAILGADVATDGPFLLDGIARGIPIEYMPNTPGVFRVTIDTESIEQTAAALFGMDGYTSMRGREFFNKPFLDYFDFNEKNIVLPLNELDRKLFSYLSDNNSDAFEKYCINTGFIRENILLDELQRAKNAKLFTIKNDSIATSDKIYDLALARQFVFAQLDSLPVDLREAAQQFIRRYDVAFNATQSNPQLISNLEEYSSQWIQKIPTQEEFIKFKEKVLLKTPSAQEALVGLDNLYEQLNDIFNDKSIQVIYPGTQYDLTSELNEGYDLTVALQTPTTTELTTGYTILKTMQQTNPELQYHLVVLPPYNTGMSFPAGNAQTIFQFITPNNEYSRTIYTHNGNLIEGSYQGKRFVNPAKTGVNHFPFDAFRSNITTP